MDRWTKWTKNKRLMYQTKQDYKYQLDKSSRKHICPRCGKKSFVLYLDEYGTPLDEEVGKCDRKDNCNWHYTPKQYFQDRKPINTSTLKPITSPRMTRPKPIPPDFIPPEILPSTMKGYEHNSLMIFLHSFFDSLIGSDEVNRVAIEYGVGTSNQFGGSPIFWQIDEHGNIRSGKIMGYDSTTGKRVKQPRPQLAWVHSLMREQYPDFRLQQCFFGSHRLIKAEQRMKALNEERKALSLNGEVKPIVGLFESEKAVLIAAMALVWGKSDNLIIPVSCGGCEGFNPTDEKKRDPFDGIRLLKNRKVVLFPDEGKFGEWEQKAKALKGFSSEVYISTVMERNLHPVKVECEINPGDALDDLLLRYFKEGKDVANLILTSYGYKDSHKIV
ncbi:DUF6371 domain-containing protein [uncultured Bacteroides sp.]|uniref:DUF6371 domain-containing protein n=1 Tax=uncultured Bacteroides sp. TaxID=162156 RepID=UPI0025B6A2B5|nr:DUF6371 domain-containing protein [uncultured Bacteroides sp.]